MGRDLELIFNSLSNIEQLNHVKKMYEIKIHIAQHTDFR